MASESQSSSTPQDLTGTHHHWLISALLVLLTTIVALACIVVLSATLTQTRVTASAGENGSISIRKLDYAGRKWSKLQVLIDANTAELSDDRRATAELTANKTITAAEQASAFKEVENKLVAFQSRIRGIDDQLLERIRQKGHDVQVANISAAKESLSAQDKAYSPIILAIENAYHNFLIAQRSAVGAAAKLKANEDSIKAQEDQLSWSNIENDKVFEFVKAGIGADKDARGRIENAFYELNINNFDCGRSNTRCGTLGGALNRGLYHLLTLRQDLLALLLVIFMGILGSALQISHAYFMKNQVQSIGGYFQRISVGAMTALVIFIVAKAGVPVIADPSRLGGEAPINPYFVSFLAIVSGLLSENAIANVQEQGRKLFGGNGGQPNRWARHDLTEDLKAQNMTIPALAEYLAVDAKAAEAMLKGEKTIDPQQQKTIAICLRKDLRELFTDMPPHPQ